MGTNRLKGSKIERMACDALESLGFVCWRALQTVAFFGKGKFGTKQADIFGVFDIVCFRPNQGSFLFVQVTHRKSMSARVRKVEEFIERTGFPAENACVMAWSGRGEMKREPAPHFKVIWFDGRDGAVILRQKGQWVTDLRFA